MQVRTESNETIRDRRLAGPRRLDSGESSEDQLQSSTAWVRSRHNARALQGVPVHAGPHPGPAARTKRRSPAGAAPARMRGFLPERVVCPPAQALCRGCRARGGCGCGGSRRDCLGGLAAHQGAHVSDLFNRHRRGADRSSTRRLRGSSQHTEPYALDRRGQRPAGRPGAGEVLFEVAHDSTRPFRVTVGNSEIRDLATEFDVYRKSNGSVVVTVLSGQVADQGAGQGRRSAGLDGAPAQAQRADRVHPASLIADVHTVSAPKSVRWREGLLETEGQSFASVVTELNRYSNKPILIADPRLEAADYQVWRSTSTSMTCRPRSSDIQQLEPPIVVTDTGDSYVLTYKADAAASGRGNAISKTRQGAHDAGGRTPMGIRHR